MGNMMCLWKLSRQEDLFNTCLGRQAKSGIGRTFVLDLAGVRPPETEAVPGIRSSCGPPSIVARISELPMQSWGADLSHFLDEFGAAVDHAAVDLH